MKRYLQSLASLKLTVVLFTLAMFLIFAGTLAQVDQGIWQVMRRYFRSFWVLIELQLFVPEKVATVPGVIPFPGGFLIGGLLLANLVAAHVARFKYSWKRVGIVVLHLGVILMLVSEVVTAVLAEEGSMSISEGGYANYVEDIREVELAIIDASHPQHDEVVVIPESILKRQHSVIRHERLPFEINVEHWMANSQVFGPAMAPPGSQPEATVGFGQRLVAQEVPEISGVEEQMANAPSAYLTITHEGKGLGRWLASWWLNPQPIRVGDQTYFMRLRFKRTYKPYTIHLIDFRHDRFTGTNKPRNFSSLVRVVNPARHDDREVLIYMNHPMRYEGETFYQASFEKGDTGTVLQVVRNPGWLIPYISCALIAVGMTTHFGTHLLRFAKRVHR